MINFWETMPKNILYAHEFSSYHREQLESSSKCGCFYCLRIFSPRELSQDKYDWTDDGQTALCPFCGIDSIIGDASGFEITKDFLKEMKKWWFDTRVN